MADAIEHIVDYVETKVTTKRKDELFRLALILAAIAIVGVLALVFSRKE